MREALSSVSPKGQVTIPASIRRMLGVRAKDKVSFRVIDDRVEIVAVRSPIDALYRSIPALKRPLSDQEMVRIAAEDHARHVADEGLDR